MSLSDQFRVSCPKCNQEVEVTFYKSVNVSQDPQLREMLFEDTLNVGICSSCNNRFQLEDNFLYHDMDRQFTVQYFPPQMMEMDGFFDQFEKEFPAKQKTGDMGNVLSGQLMEGASYLFTPHPVFSRDGMKQMVIFYENLLVVV